MKVLVLAADLGTIGGIQRYEKDLIRGLWELGAEVRVVEKKSGKLDFAWRSFKETLAMRPDVVLCGHINFIPVCILLKLLTFDFFILTYGIEVWDLNFFGYWGLTQAGKIFTISSFTRAKMLGKYPSLQPKIFLLPNPVHKPPPPSSGLQELKRRYGDEVILSVCRLAKSERYKGYDRVIQALPRVLRRFPQAVYVIVGDGDDRVRIEKLIADLNLDRAVVLAGFLDEKELNDYYNLANVFILPSTGEGFGFVYLEALVRGKPTIAGSKDGSVDPLLNGKLGLLIDPENISQIEEAIIAVLSKKIKPEFLEAKFLKAETLKHYGFNTFKSRITRDVLNRV